MNNYVLKHIKLQKTQMKLEFHAHKNIAMLDFQFEKGLHIQNVHYAYLNFAQVVGLLNMLG